MSGTDPDDRPGPAEPGPPTRSDPPTTSGPSVESGPPGRQVWPDVPGATPSWQGAPGFSGVAPDSVPPHAPLPGAPPYPPGTEPERAAVADRSPQLPGVAAVLPRCVAAAAGWVAVALLLALFTGVGSWPLRGLALVVPWGLAALALVFPARRGAGPGGLVALAFAPFWLVHAFLVGLLGW